MLAERIFLGLLNTFVQSQGQRQPSAKCNTLGVKAQSRDRFWSSGKNLGSWVSKRGEKEDRTRLLGRDLEVSAELFVMFWLSFS